MKSRDQPTGHSYSHETMITTKLPKITAHLCYATQEVAPLKREQMSRSRVTPLRLWAPHSFSMLYPRNHPACMSPHQHAPGSCSSHSPFCVWCGEEKYSQFSSETPHTLPAPLSPEPPLTYLRLCSCIRGRTRRTSGACRVPGGRTTGLWECVEHMTCKKSLCPDSSGGVGTLQGSKPQQ